MSDDEKVQEMARVREKAMLDEASALSGARRERTIEIALKLLKRGRPLEEIVEDTGLSHQEIEALRQQ